MPGRRAAAVCSRGAEALGAGWPARWAAARPRPAAVVSGRWGRASRHWGSYHWAAAAMIAHSAHSTTVNKRAKYIPRLAVGLWCHWRAHSPRSRRSAAESRREERGRRGETWLAQCCVLERTAGLPVVLLAAARLRSGRRGGGGWAVTGRRPRGPGPRRGARRSASRERRLPHRARPHPAPRARTGPTPRRPLAEGKSFIAVPSARAVAAVLFLLQPLLRLLLSESFASKPPRAHSVTHRALKQELYVLQRRVWPTAPTSFSPWRSLFLNFDRPFQPPHLLAARFGRAYNTCSLQSGPLRVKLMESVKNNDEPSSTLFVQMRASN